MTGMTGISNHHQDHDASDVPATLIAMNAQNPNVPIIVMTCFTATLPLVQYPPVPPNNGRLPGR